MSSLQVRVDYDCYSQFLGILKLAQEQSEYRQLFGDFWIWIIYCSRWLLFRYLGRRIVHRLTVEDVNRNVFAGLEISHKGELGTLVATGDPSIQSRALVLLARATVKLMSASPQVYTVRTFNDRLFRALTRAGFEHIRNKDAYILTLPLGKFTFSWTATHIPPRPFNWLMQVRVLRYMRKQ